MLRSVAGFAAGVSLFGLLSLWLAGAGLQLGAGAIIFVFAMFSIMLGQLCLISWGRIEDTPSLMSVTYAMGTGMLSVILSILTVLLNIALWPAAALCCGAVLAAWFWQRPHTPKIEIGEALSLGVLSVALLILLLSPISSPATLESDGYLPIWSDYYVHAETIYSFSSPFLLGQDIAAAGMERVFYHYAPFMLPALVQSSSGITGLVASTAVLLPLGLLVALTGGIALCLRLGGVALALLAFLLLIAIPGPDAFGISSGWFDFDWLLIASPGSGMSIGMAFAVIWLMLQWAGAELRPSRLIVLIAVSAASIILLRVQIFMLSAPVLVGFCLLTSSPRVRRVSLISAVCLFVLIVLTLSVSDSLRMHWLDLAQPHIYFDIVLNWSQGYAELKAGWGKPNFLNEHSRNLLIVLGSSLGLWSVLWPTLLAGVAWQKKLCDFDLIVPLALLTYAALILAMPTGGNGDISEYKHRHFVLLYMLATISAAHLGLRLLPVTEYVHRLMNFVVAGAVVAIALITWRLDFDAPDSQAMPWSTDYHSVPFTPGVEQAAAFIAAKAEPGDLFVMNPAWSRNWLGAQPQLISLSGMQAYIGRADQMLKRGGCIAQVTQERLDVIDKLEASQSWQDGAAILKAAGVRWYIRLAGDTAGWADIADPVLFTSEVSVYDTKAQAHAQALAPPC